MRQAYNVLAPTLGNMVCVTMSTTTIVTTLSATGVLGVDLLSKGAFITVRPEGGNVSLAFSDNAVDGTTDLDTAAATTRTKSGWFVPDGESQDYRLTRVQEGPGITAARVGAWRTKLVHLCSAATKKLHIQVSSGPTNTV